MRILCTLLLASLLSAGESVISNGSFERVQMNGGRLLPIGWEWYAWDRSLDDVRIGVVRSSYDGSNAVAVRSITTGAAGIVSHPIALTSNTLSYSFTFYQRKSADYAGNRPWIFITIWQNDRFINNIDAPKTLADNEWKQLSFTVRRSDIPAACTHIRVCLATLSLGTAYEGTLFYDAVTGIKNDN
ncbi:MAG: hypothetical protein AABZ39_12685 [Spirochaetota bacterium]